MSKTKEEKIHDLLLALSKLGEESLDKSARTGVMDWSSIGLAIAHETSRGQAIIEVAYSALEDWNFHSLCALLDYIFPDMHPHFHTDSQEWLGSMQNVEKLLNKRGEMLLLDSDGSIHNYRLDVKLNKLDSENNTFKYIHVAGKRTYSPECADCKNEVAHTDQKHFENMPATSQMTREQLQRQLERYDADDIHIACESLDFPTGWEYFDEELKGYTLEDCQKLLHAVQQFADPMEEKVDLLASGYQWICPNCETLNHIIETEPNVTCAKCGAYFDTHPPEHV